MSSVRRKTRQDYGGTTPERRAKRNAYNHKRRAEKHRVRTIQLDAAREFRSQPSNQRNLFEYLKNFVMEEDEYIAIANSQAEGTDAPFVLMSVLLSGTQEVSCVHGQFAYTLAFI